jgi:ATP-dependent Lon protease
MEKKKRTRRPRRKKLPLLPLKEFVMFPHTLYPLLVGRERSLQAVEQAYEKSEFLVLSLEEENTRKAKKNPVRKIGTLGKIVHFLRMPNGLIKALVEGIDRVIIDEVIDLETHYQVKYSSFETIYDMKDDSSQWIEHLKNVFKRYVQNHQELPDEIYYHLDALKDADKILDFITLHIDADPEKKQEILEEPSLRKRLEKTVVLANEALAVVEVEKEIEDRVKENLMESQRKMILQEQMRIIKEELEGVEEEYEDELYEKLHNAGLPSDVFEKAMKEYRRLQTMPGYSPEASVLRTYLEWLSDMPWKKRTRDRLDIQHVRKILDEDHYGLDKVKDRILEHLAVLKKSRKRTQGTILCFAGPPGVGKTSLATSIARALNRKFVRVSLGGVRDEAEIRGHRRTYVGALPGRIIQGLKKVGTRNPVFLLDEIDKMSMDFRGDPSAALLEALDPQQNKNFSDHYLEVEFDLSEVFFITTANDKSQIPWALLDRMEIIDIPGYLEIEKVHIAQQHLIPQNLKKVGLKDGEVTFTDPAVRNIIHYYTREAGVRNLQRLIESVLRKILIHYFEKKIHFPVVVDAKDVEKWLGAPKYQDMTTYTQNRPGVVNGLAWTPTGGDIIKIEVLILPGKDKIHLTGKLGDVMKESAEIALTYVKSILSKLQKPANFFEKKDIHIHIPEGAVPKDGPSAGITMVTAILSAILKKEIPSDLAMTGEITLQGQILPIGGLSEKIMAARRYGMKNVFIPIANQGDWKELDDSLKEGLNVSFVDDYHKILETLFSDYILN